MTVNQLGKIIFGISISEEQTLNSFYSLKFQKILAPGGKKAFSNFHSEGYFSLPSIGFKGEKFIKIEGAFLDVSRKEEIFRIAIGNEKSTIEDLNSKYDRPPIEYVDEIPEMLDLEPILLNDFKMAIIRNKEKVKMYDHIFECVVDEGLYFIDKKSEKGLVILADYEIPLNIAISSSPIYIEDVLMKSVEIEFI